MGKGGFLTPKAIANRIKAKGLQKLRWYCEMCEKQCRDENGFKCHTMSESHQRQMRVLRENPDYFVDMYTKKFESEFMKLVSHRWRTVRIGANQAYQEYIADRNHVHMNATRFTTLTDFIKHLGREGKIVAEETEKGWFITYVDQDPDSIAREKALKKKERADLIDQQRAAKRMRQMMELQKEADPNASHTSAATELKKNDTAKPVTISLAKIKTKTKPKNTPASEVDLSSSSSISTSTSSSSTSTTHSTTKTATTTVSPEVTGETQSNDRPAKRQKTMSALAELRQAEERKESAAAATVSSSKTSARTHTRNWIATGIVVKILNKKLKDGAFYKKKATIEKVIDKYVAVVKLVDSGTRIKIDQEHLSTVLPGFGRPVLVLRGKYRGDKAELVSLQHDKFSATIKLTSGPDKGREVRGVDYDDISKLAK